jgi:phosphatidylethanolamine-binding protein
LTAAPTLSLSFSEAASYVAFLLDLSVQNNGSNTTLLHWLLPGLSGTTILNSTATPLAPYFPPGPPPGQTHNYAVFLYKEPSKFAVPADYAPFFNNLTASVYNRVGFNLTRFAGEAGLGAAVAANWFLVGTPNATTSSVAPTGTGAVASSGIGSPIPTFTQASGAMDFKGVGLVGVFVSALGFALNIL